VGTKNKRKRPTTANAVVRFVIASQLVGEAIQRYIIILFFFLDCFVASLRAMTVGKALGSIRARVNYAFSRVVMIIKFR